MEYSVKHSAVIVAVVAAVAAAVVAVVVSDCAMKKNVSVLTLVAMSYVLASRQILMK